MKRRSLVLAAMAVVGLGACTRPVPYLPAAPEDGPEAQVRVRVGSLMVRDTVLPSYATDPEILVEAANGALVQLGKAVWADETANAVTQTLAAALARRSGATVAAEPWPLSSPPQAELAVRYNRFVAQADGQFVASGQFALASPDGRLRERVVAFHLSLSIGVIDPQHVAAARARAIEDTAAEVLKYLR